MYQPRRADSPAADQPRAIESGRANRSVARRSARPWYTAATDRVGQVFLGLAITGTAGALAIAGTASAAPVAAPVTTPTPLRATPRSRVTSSVRRSRRRTR